MAMSEQLHRPTPPQDFGWKRLRSLLKLVVALPGVSSTFCQHLKPKGEKLTEVLQEGRGWPRLAAHLDMTSRGESRKQGFDTDLQCGTKFAPPQSYPTVTLNRCRTSGATGSAVSPFQSSLASEHLVGQLRSNVLQEPG